MTHIGNGRKKKYGLEDSNLQWESMSSGPWELVESMEEFICGLWVAAVELMVDVDRSSIIDNGKKKPVWVFSNLHPPCQQPAPPNLWVCPTRDYPYLWCIRQ